MESAPKPASPPAAADTASRRRNQPAMRPSVWQVVFILTLLSHAGYAIFAWPSHLANALGWNRRSLHTAPLPDLYEASVLELQVRHIRPHHPSDLIDSQAGLDAGHFTSVDLVKVCVNCLQYALSR